MKKFIGQCYLFIAFSLAGTSVIAGRFLSGRLGTFTIAALSLFFAVLFLLPLCGKTLFAVIRSLKARDLLLLSLQAVCGIFLFRVFLLNGLQRTSAGEAGVLTGATPAMTALLAMVFLREQATVKKIAGVLFTVAGILLIQGLLTNGTGFSPVHLAGNLLVLCAASSESVFNILSRLTSKSGFSVSRTPMHPSEQTVIVSFIALLFCFIPALFEQPVYRLTGAGLSVWAALVWYGVFVTGLAYICWYAGINRSSAITAAAFSGMMPFTSMALSVLLLGERLGWLQWTGAVFVAAGILFIGLEEAQKAPKVHSQTTDI